MSYSVSLSFVSQPSIPMLRAALVVSPPAAVMAHIQRLSLHKVLGSKSADRAVLLNDYVERLKGFAEFAVFLACKHFWENDPSDFVPKLGKLAACVEEIESELRWKLKCLLNPPKELPKPEPKPLTYREIDQEKWTMKEYDHWVSDAQGMVDVAENSRGIISVDRWKEETDLRQSVREKWMLEAGKAY